MAADERLLDLSAAFDCVDHFMMMMMMMMIMNRLDVA